MPTKVPCCCCYGHYNYCYGCHANQCCRGYIAYHRFAAFEAKVFTADKKNAGTAHSLYLVLVGDQRSSKVFAFKNSSRSPVLQRGQTDTFQLATPPLGALKAVNVAHCPRKRHRNAESASPEGRGSSWFLFQIVLTKLEDKTKTCFLCRQWVESSPSPKELQYTQITIT